jgi:hypothetical protein
VKQQFFSNKITAPNQLAVMIGMIQVMRFIHTLHIMRIKNIMPCMYILQFMQALRIVHNIPTSVLAILWGSYGAMW